MSHLEKLIQKSKASKAASQERHKERMRNIKKEVKEMMENLPK